VQVWLKPHACLPGCYEGAKDEFGVQPTQVLCTKLIDSSFFDTAALEGMTVYEPFEGMCAGVNALLQSRVEVASYIYSDKDPSARSVAKHRVVQLSAQFSLAFPPFAWDKMFAILYGGTGPSSPKPIFISLACCNQAHLHLHSRLEGKDEPRSLRAPFGGHIQGCH